MLFSVNPEYPAWYLACSWDLRNICGMNKCRSYSIMLEIFSVLSGNIFLSLATSYSLNHWLFLNV